VIEKFLKKYFLESKTAKGKAAISSFHQFPDESLSEALERFRGLLQTTPIHGFSEPIQLNIFIDWLRPQSKLLLDASAGGKIKMKTPVEAMDLIESMVHFERSSPHSYQEEFIGANLTGHSVGTKQVDVQATRDTNRNTK